jgi:hypothetical protein
MRRAHCTHGRRHRHAIRCRPHSCWPAHARTHLEAFLAAVLGLAALTALPGGAQGAAVAARLAFALAAFLVDLTPLFLAALLLPALVAVVASSVCGF